MAKKEPSTYIHVDNQPTPTWSHAEHVKKNPDATFKQTPKTVAETKRNVLLLQTCGIAGNATPT